jgi:hypothetical protein
MEPQVSIDQQLSSLGKELVAQFSSNTRHLATFGGLPTHSQVKVLNLGRPQ